MAYEAGTMRRLAKPEVEARVVRLFDADPSFGAARRIAKALRIRRGTVGLILRGAGRVMAGTSPAHRAAIRTGQVRARARRSLVLQEQDEVRARYAEARAGGADAREAARQSLLRYVRRCQAWMCFGVLQVNVKVCPLCGCIAGTETT